MSGGSGVPTVQERNPALVTNLSSDFVRRGEATTAWAGLIPMFQMLPGIRGLWVMSSYDSATVYDMSFQGRNVNTNLTPTFGYAGLIPYINLVAASGQYLNRADEAGLDITGGLTLGAWIWMDLWAGAPGSWIISKFHWTAGNQRSYELMVDNTGHLTLCTTTLGTDASKSLVASSGTVSVGAWHFVVGRMYPSLAFSVIIDNVWTNKVAPFPASIYSGTAELEIGAVDNGTCFFDGKMAVVFLCASTLSTTMISALYEHTRPLFGK